eukprot:364761-Chlamydomonas_euryale.AAC.2
MGGAVKGVGVGCSQWSHGGRSEKSRDGLQSVEKAGVGGSGSGAGLGGGVGGRERVGGSQLARQDNLPQADMFNLEGRPLDRLRCV